MFFYLEILNNSILLSDHSLSFLDNKRWYIFNTKNYGRRQVKLLTYWTGTDSLERKIRHSNLHYIETDLLCLLRHEMSLMDIVIQRVNGELHFNNQPLYFSTLLCIHIKKTKGLY